MAKEIQEELLRLVTFYAKVDKTTGTWSTELLDQATLLRIDSGLNSILNQCLLEDGTEKEFIDKNYKKLTLHFHPDKVPHYTPQVLWLEAQLSGAGSNDTCFKTLQVCYQKLTEPRAFKSIELSSIHTLDDLRGWLTAQKEQAKTYSTQNLYDSLLQLLNRSSDFLDETGRVKPYAFKTLISFVPVILASFGAVMIIEEFLALYLLYFLLLRGGQRLSNSDYTEVRQFGEHLRSHTTVTAMLTTTVFVRILELLFWSSQRCLHATIEASSRFFAPLLGEALTGEECTDEAQNGTLVTTEPSGLVFATAEFKMLALPFERYLMLNEQQYFVGFRSGSAKQERIKQFLRTLVALDKNNLLTFEQKLNDVCKELDAIKRDKQVYSSKTASTTDYVLRVAHLLAGRPQECASPSNELLGLQCKTPELKAIAAPFEHYLHRAQTQFFQALRIGGIKKTSIECFLFYLQLVDQNETLSLDEKLHQVAEQLSRLKEDKDVYAGRAARALDYAQGALGLLLPSSEGEERVISPTH